MPTEVHTADYLALCVAIVANPDDDTPRLMLADYFDGLDTVRVPCPTCSGYASDPCPRCNGKGKVYESPGPSSFRVECHECTGTGKFLPGYHTQRDPASGRDEGGWTNCQTCNGAGSRTPGFVVDTSDSARAELIRVQCELSQSLTPVLRRCTGEDEGPVPDPMVIRHNELRIRERKLFTAHADRWRKGPVCEKCVNGYEKHPRTGEVIEQWCRTCDRTCDAGGLIKMIRSPRVNMEQAEVLYGPRTVDYVRGMKRVHATLAECVKEVPDHDNNCRCTVPSDWLRSVLTHHPDVMEVWVDLSFDGDGARYSWLKSSLPEGIFKEVEGHDGESADAARTALARGVVRWGRPFIKESS